MARINQRFLRVAKYRASELDGFIKSGVAPTDLVAKILDVVTSSLANPKDVQYQDVRIKPFQGGRILCGEVNAKNLSGAYIGFRKFYASNSSVVFETSSDKNPGRARASNAGLYAACTALFNEGDVHPTGACDAETIERLRRSGFTVSDVISTCGSLPGGILDQEIHVNTISRLPRSSSASGKKVIVPDAYGPSIHMNEYGQAITLTPQGRGVPGEHLKIKPNAYGPGIHMDQYGRPVRERRWPQ